jgi:hypothetical protein
VTIGSIATVSPDRTDGPTVPDPVVGHLRVLVHLGADAVPDVVLDDPVVAPSGLARRDDGVLDGRADVVQRRPPQRRDPGPHGGSVASISARSLGARLPDRRTISEIAASPCQPSTIAPQSIETRSPSRSTRVPGTPCTTSSLTLTHSGR